MVNPHDAPRIQVWASRDFAYRLLQNRLPSELSKGETRAEVHFRDLVGLCLPGYTDLCGRRYSTGVLLEESGSFADLAFVTAVWRYSQALGADGPKIFPPGLYAWPPVNFELQLPVSIGSAASSSSGSAASIV